MPDAPGWPNCFLQPSLNWPSLAAVKELAPTDVVRQGECARPALCPLSRVSAGTVVCIRELAASVEVMARLREMGFCEQQEIKLLSREGSLICQVCNARLGISEKLAEAILVEPLPGRLKAA
jgi:Fe2+ transport system protein FeoA